MSVRCGSLIGVIAFALSLLAPSAIAVEPEAPMIVVFYEEGCPDCNLIEELIAELVLDLPSSAIERYEIAEPGALDLFNSLAAAYGIEADTVPTVFVGDRAIIGGGRSAEFALRDTIGTCAVRGCPSPFDRIRPPEFPWADVLRLGALAGLLVLLIIAQPL